MESRILVSGPFESHQIVVAQNTPTTKLTNPSIELMIEETWLKLQSRAKQNDLLLYNGLSYRLDNVEFNSETAKLTLQLGEFDFRTRKSLELIVGEIIELGHEYLGLGLAIGSLLQTSDGLYVFGQRSGRTMADSAVDFIGGIVESNIEVSEKGLRQMLLLELLEEANIDAREVTINQYLGIILSNRGNAVLLADVRLNITKSQLEHKFTFSDKVEISNLIFVESSNLIQFLKSVGGYKLSVVELLQILNYKL